MITSRMVRESGCQCLSRNNPWFYPSILRYSEIWWVADGAVAVFGKGHPLWFLSVYSMDSTVNTCFSTGPGLYTKNLKSFLTLLWQLLHPFFILCLYVQNFSNVMNLFSTFSLLFSQNSFFYSFLTFFAQRDTSFKTSFPFHIKRRSSSVVHP